MQTSNLILLAQEGFRYLRRMPNGFWVGKPGKRGATHRLTCTRPRPRYLTKDVPANRIRIAYDDPKNFLEYETTAEGKAQAEAKLTDWRLLAKQAVPTSAVAKPFGRKYDTFCAGRAEAAANGSLYNKAKPETNMAKKNAPKPPKAARNKDQKNGVTRPKDGTTTGKVWDIADKLGADRAAVIKEATKRGINLATVTTQYGKWRKYNGMEGRTAKPAKKKPSPPKKKPAPPVPAATA